MSDHSNNADPSDSRHFDNTDAEPAETSTSDVGYVTLADEDEDKASLKKAFMDRDLKRIDEIFKNNSSLVNKPWITPYGETPLHYAFRLKFNDISKYLLRRQDIQMSLHQMDCDGFLPLHTAISYSLDDEDILRILIDKTGPIGLVLKTKKEDTAIHMASRRGRVGALDILCPHLPRDAIHSLNQAGRPAIHECIENWKVVSCLLRYGASRSTDKHRNTLLHAAVAPGIVNLHLGMETRRALLERGEHLGAQNDDEDTPFHLLARNLNSGPDSTGMGLKALRQLLGLEEEAPLSEHTRLSLVDALQKSNKTGDTVLHLVAKEIYGDVSAEQLKQKQAKEAVESILGVCPNILVSTDKQGNTPLHRACVVDNWMMAQALLQAGKRRESDPASMAKTKNKAGDIPLHLAVRKGHIQTVKKLMAEHQSDETILIRDEQQETPMHIAAHQGQPETLEELLKWTSYQKVASADCEKDLRDGRGRTPLHIAADLTEECKATSLLDQILKGCTDPKFLNQAEPTDRWTALHFAARRGHERLVELLLLNGADSSKTDKSSLLAADIARRANHINVADFIRQYRPRSFRIGLEPRDDSIAKIDHHFLALIWPKWDKSVRQQHGEPPRMWPQVTPVPQMIFSAHDNSRDLKDNYLKMSPESFVALRTWNVDVAIHLAPIHQCQIRLASCGREGWIMNEGQEKDQMRKKWELYEEQQMDERRPVRPIEGLYGSEGSREVYLYDSKVFVGKERSTRWIHFPANNVGSMMMADCQIVMSVC